MTITLLRYGRCEIIYLYGRGGQRGFVRGDGLRLSAPGKCRRVGPGGWMYHYIIMDHFEAYSRKGTAWRGTGRLHLVLRHGEPGVHRPNTRREWAGAEAGVLRRQGWEAMTEAERTSVAAGPQAGAYNATDLNGSVRGGNMAYLAGCSTATATWCGLT
jgi:hypothetical protein